MPLLKARMANVGGNLSPSMQKQINMILKLIDDTLAKLAEQGNLKSYMFRLLRNCHFLVLVNDKSVFVVASSVRLGEIQSRRYLDVEEKFPNLDMDTAIFLVKRDFLFEEGFGFSFPKKLLTETEVKKKNEVNEIVKKYIDDEINYLERLTKIVNIKPIFHGRDFMINNNMVFVLSPFGDPFNTIFADHIKPTVEAIEGVICLRADNIYDNKPIIEDIWRNINEAHIVIAELTNRNPNVFYETGIAHTIGKEVILITQNIDDVPFDLRHLRCIVYEFTPRGVQALSDNLSSTILNIRSRLLK